MKDVIIIGAGFAGLSSGTALAAKGHRVSVLEGRQVLGGRAYSFKDPQTGDVVDNGQHLFMGAYHETQRFLARIGTSDKLRFQNNLRVDFVRKGGKSAKLSCWPLPAPLHLLSGLLRLSTLSWADRWRMGRLNKALKKAEEAGEKLDNVTADAWLNGSGQSKTARHCLWDPIILATLNEDPKIASAYPLVTVLRQAFFGGRKESRIGLSRVGLSDLYAVAARQFIESRGGTVETSVPVARILEENGRVTGVQLRNGTIRKADAVISAVPAHAFVKLFSPERIAKEPTLANAAQLRPSPIISIHLWLDRAISNKTFAGMIDTQVQWFFNISKYHDAATNEGHVTLVISGAHRFVDWPDTRLTTLALEELRQLFPDANGAVVSRSLVIKEHFATLSPTVGTEALRPTYQSFVEGLWIAGDWTKTGLPATIESACVSGHACAALVHGALQTGQHLQEAAHVG